MMMEILFYIAASVALISAALAITGCNIVYSLLYMIITMVAISMIYILLGAPFPAALQIIVYTGAIMVLFVFVTMMLKEANSLQNEKQLFKPLRSILPVILCGTLFIELAFLLSPLANILNTTGATLTPISVRDIGLKLYGPYIILVEIAALLLISALVGAFHIGRRKEGAS
jgi:NADH-quinone oxidoreductase subunit J